MTDAGADDRAAIEQLIARHAQLTDDKQPSQRVMLYVEDCAFTGPDGSTVQGRSELLASFERLSGGPGRGKHIVSNTVVTVDGDEAVAQSDYAYFRVAGDGITVLSVGRYDDAFVRHESSWRFRSRRIRPTVAPESG